jgi:two-component system chemotaxis response regulator CheB
MPRSAIQTVKVDYVAPVDKIPEILRELVMQQVSAGNGAGKTSPLAKETHFAELDMTAVEDENRPGTPSQFACPECGGVLWEIDNEAMVRFRCRVGHAFSANSLQVEQNEAIEAALWAAMRALEESASLARRMAENAERSRHPKLAARFREREKSKKDQADTLRRLISESKESIVAQDELAS